MSQVALRAASGRLLLLDGQRWLQRATGADERVLELVDGPVLDVGCGPGRHVLSLARRGLVTMGIDISLPALIVARSAGAPVLQRSIFDRVPASGRWGTALLLDGNVGIGGCPTTLLRRVRKLLRPGGRILVEVSGPGPADGVEQVRFELDHAVGPWFLWASVGVDGLAALAGDAGLDLVRAWCDGERWFAWLE